MENCDASISGSEYAGVSERKYFKVYKFAEATGVEATCTRRDFRRIYLLTGQAQVHFEGKIIQTGNATLFFEPLGPYFLKKVSGSNLNFVCLFTKNLLEGYDSFKAYWKLMAFADSSGLAFFDLDGTQKNFMVNVFEQMIFEQDTGYLFNHELFCDYLSLVFHEVLKRLVRQNLD